MNHAPMPTAAQMPNCCLCGSSATRPFRKANVHSLIVCGSCGLIYALDRHEGIGISADQEKFLREYLREEESFGDYFNRKLELIEQYHKAGQVLDFGCGAGTFLRCARARGWEVTGVEGSAPAADYARSTGLRIHEGIIENVSLSGAFDVVTAFQTIEHFADPVAFLKTVHDLLKPGGVVLLTTPDRNSLLGRLMGKRWFGYFNDEHVFFYDAHSFKTTLEKVGFSGVMVKGESGRALSPSWVFTRLFDYYYRHPNLVLGLVVRFKSVWTWFDFVRVHEPGVDLVAIGWKR